MSNAYYYPSAIDEIEIDEELEEIIKKTVKFDFPAIYVNADSRKFYFNAAATQHIRSSAFRISFSTEYIVFTPATKQSKNAYAITHCTKANGLYMVLPVELKSKKLKGGAYKLYKYKDGLCFKRYEPLEVQDG